MDAPHNPGLPDELQEIRGIIQRADEALQLAMAAALRIRVTTIRRWRSKVWTRRAPRCRAGCRNADASSTRPHYGKTARRLLFLHEGGLMDRRDIVVIGGSRGAFGVLRALAITLPPDLPATVCIVLHIGRHDSVLPELMSRSGRLPAKHAADGEAMEHGRIYVAPPGRHMLLGPHRLKLDDGATENFARPAIDPLFRSAALHHGERVVGVVLSGDLDDGAAGLATVRAHEGYSLVQDPTDCEAPSMPRAALAAAGADKLTNMQQLTQHIVEALEGAPLKRMKKEHSVAVEQLNR